MLWSKFQFSIHIFGGILRTRVAQGTVQSPKQSFRCHGSSDSSRTPPRLAPCVLAMSSLAFVGPQATVATPQARQLVIRVINCKPVNLCTTVQLVFETFGIILTLWQTYRMLRGLGQCRALGQLSGELQFWAGKMLLSLQFVLARREATSRSFNLMVQPLEADTLESPPWRVFAYFCFDFLTCFVSSS